MFEITSTIKSGDKYPDDFTIKTNLLDLVEIYYCLAHMYNNRCDSLRCGTLKENDARRRIEHMRRRKATIDTLWYTISTQAIKERLDVQHIETIKPNFKVYVEAPRTSDDIAVKAVIMTFDEFNSYLDYERNHDTIDMIRYIEQLKEYHKAHNCKYTPTTNIVDEAVGTKLDAEIAYGDIN